MEKCGAAVMIKPEDRKEAYFRSVGVVLVITIILIGVVAWVGTGPASTGPRSRVDLPQRGISIAKPESMKHFPDELIPLP